MLMEYSPTAYLRQSSRRCPSDSLGCLLCNFSWCGRGPVSRLVPEAGRRWRGHLGRTLPVGRVSARPVCRLRAQRRLPALPHGWTQPARRHCHLLEYRPSRRSGQAAETSQPDSRARPPDPHPAPWVGSHPAHRRIPVVKAPIATLAYDSAPYRNRPELGQGASQPGISQCPRQPTVPEHARDIQALHHHVARRFGYRRSCL